MHILQHSPIFVLHLNDISNANQCFNALGVKSSAEVLRKKVNIHIWKVCLQALRTCFSSPFQVPLPTDLDPNMTT
jgi:hypothetical protein